MTGEISEVLLEETTDRDNLWIAQNSKHKSANIPLAHLHASSPTVGTLLDGPGLATDSLAAVTDDVLLEGQLSYGAGGRHGLQEFYIFNLNFRSLVKRSRSKSKICRTLEG